MRPAATATDITNLGLMLLACWAAYKIPRELLVLSYAVLGPAHYLTEISWLHDRKYFTTETRDWMVLCGFTLLVLVFGATPLGGILTWICFGIACVMAFSRFDGLRSAIGLIFLVSILALRHLAGFTLLISVLLPTVVHVFVFTWMFMLHGALRSRSVWGYLSCLALPACAACFFIWPPVADQSFSGYDVSSQLKHFKGMGDALLEVLGFINTDQTVLAVTGFLAFAYTYHYLNWFSKTQVIRWHEVGLRRIIVIAVVYSASIGLYAYDYDTGFFVLLCLSLAHVILEFPLNHRTWFGILVELRKRFRPAL